MASLKTFQIVHAEDASNVGSPSNNEIIDVLCISGQVLVGMFDSTPGVLVTVESLPVDGDIAGWLLEPGKSVSITGDGTGLVCFVGAATETVDSIISVQLH